MTNNNLNLPHLVQVCEAATPGPWSVHHGTTAIHVDTDADPTFSVCLMSTCQPDPMATARFIAAFNPTTILALLRRLMAVEQALDETLANLLQIVKNNQGGYVGDNKLVRQSIDRLKLVARRPHDAE